MFLDALASLDFKLSVCQSMSNLPFCLQLFSKLRNASGTSNTSDTSYTGNTSITPNIFNICNISSTSEIGNISNAFIASDASIKIK